MNISPKFFLEESDNISKIINYCLLLLFCFGVYFVFLGSPADYQQGNSVRIMYIHVPSAWTSLALYFLLGIFSIGFLVMKNPICDIIASSIAPIGLVFSVITLITGSLWGKPIWGAWWVWDIRLTSFAILTFFYFSYISFRQLNEDNQNTQNNAAFLAILGLINLPVVKFSVEVWNSLHQPTSILKKNGPSIDQSMLIPLLIMTLFCICYSISLSLTKAKILLYKKKLDKIWYLKAKE